MENKLTETKPILQFHCEFIKEAGPMESGATRLYFDVPQIFQDEIIGIKHLVKKALILQLYVDKTENKIDPETGEID